MTARQFLSISIDETPLTLSAGTYQPSHIQACMPSYMVKPHGQLVRVSSTSHNAYTPRLSTS